MGKKPLRPIRIEGNVAYVPLSQGYEAIIDAEDANLIGLFNWCAEVKKGRARPVRNLKDRVPGKRAMIYMYRQIISAPDEKVVDHINGNGLDNRKANLRVATQAENSRNQRIARHNTSGLKGASLHRQTGKWRAQIVVGGKRYSLGLHDTPEIAHAAYAIASAKKHGEFGRLS
jgi:hypothetical protein